MKIGSLTRISPVCFNIGVPIYKTKEDIEVPRSGRTRSFESCNSFLHLKEKVGMFLDYHVFDGHVYLQILYDQETYWVAIQYLELVKTT